MRVVPVTISVVASVGLAVGSWGMAHATSTHAHSAHAVDRSGSPTRVLTQADVDRITAHRGVPKLHGKVDAQKHITISSNPVPAGTYKLIINDSTSGHNWHIFGTGVDKKTSVGGTGTTRFRVHLSTGSYTVHCDRHPDTMTFQLNVN